MQQDPEISSDHRSGPARFVFGTLEQASVEQQQFLQSHPQGPDRWRTAIVLVAAAITLTARDNAYSPRLSTVTGAVSDIVERSSDRLDRAIEVISTTENVRLSRLAWWATWQSLSYFVIPALVIRIILGERISDYGLDRRGLFRGWQTYLVMYLVMVPVIVGVSTSASFQKTYPFLQPDAGFLTDSSYWARFGIWQAFYAVQFVALEFFFRGFLLHGTRPQLGAHSITVMMIPYCMIHFGKPLPETIGSIVAGLLLGFMSLKTRSIWPGAAVHISVALTMDMSALCQRL